VPNYQLPLTGGSEQFFPYKGKMLQLTDLGAASTLTLAIAWASETDRENIGAVDNKFRSYSASETFAGFWLTSPVDTTAKILISNHDLQVNDNQNATVKIDDSSPVRVRKGLAASVVDHAAVAVTDVNTAILGASGARRAIRFRNLGASSVALGSNALTWATRTIELASGETWLEDDGANLAWFAICNAGLTASVAAQEITE
jgi:hypothetical protein